jgi:hypothetical protein
VRARCGSWVSNLMVVLSGLRASGLVGTMPALPGLLCVVVLVVSYLYCTNPIGISVICGLCHPCGELWHRTRADGFANVRFTHTHTFE